MAIIHSLLSALSVDVVTFNTKSEERRSNVDVVMGCIGFDGLTGLTGLMELTELTG